MSRLWGGDSRGKVTFTQNATAHHKHFMNSFDVFDTLIARRFVTAELLFEQLEVEWGLPGFAARRIEADTGTRDLAGIYRALGLDRQAMARELELELAQVIPIQENLDRVRHGDLLLSDMYLQASDILTLLRAAGLDKQVTLYRSSGGKRTGDVWQRVAKGPRPHLHLGDHELSDLRNPQALGMAAELYSRAGFNPWELDLFSRGLQHTAYLIRELRLRCPCDGLDPLRFVAGQFNVPWLLAASQLLRRQVDASYAGRPLVFLGRDCQLLHRIYCAYYEPCTYLPFSRALAYTQPLESVRYLLSQAPKDAVFVDISSTGATWEWLDAPLDVLALIYSDQGSGYTTRRPHPPPRFSALTRSSEIGATNYLLEVFNCADHPYVERVESYDDKLLRAVYAGEPEFDAATVKAIQGPPLQAAALALYYALALRKELDALPAAQLRQLFAEFAAAICVQHHVEVLLPDVGEQDRQYLENLRKPQVQRRAQPSQPDLNGVSMAASYRLRNAFIDHECNVLHIENAPIETSIQETYAQCNEDLIIQAVLRARLHAAGRPMSSLSYVEIGGNHPVQTSSTYLFYRLYGARGLICEANPRLAQELARIRPGDHVLSTAVSDRPDERIKLFVARGHELSSVDKAHVDGFGWLGDLSEVVEEVLVRNMHINDVLSAHAPASHIDYLSVDIEGQDLALLKALDFSRFRPTIIQCEYEGRVDDFTAVLAPQGYALAGLTDVNAIYLLPQ